MVLAFAPGDKGTLGSGWTPGSMSLRGTRLGPGCRLSFWLASALSKIPPIFILFRWATGPGHSGSGTSKSHQEQRAEQQVDAPEGHVNSMQAVL
jgi:hypothetical protein